MKYSTISLVAVALASSLAMNSAALAQSAPTETVTVTGQKIGPVPRAIIDKILTTRIAPSKLAGKIARWKNPLCPQTLGLVSERSAAMTQRIRDVAVTVGVKVDANPHCAPNVLVNFTPTPQTFMDQIAMNRPSLLGYHDTETQAQEMAVMNHPIQAWYATETEDYRGKVQPDNRDYCDSQVQRQPASQPEYVDKKHSAPPSAGDKILPNACYYATSGMTLDNGISSDFTNVLVVADAGKIGSYSFNAVADYIALFVLSQAKSFDICDPVPSIANLMTAGCDAQWKASQLTDGDIGYLRALYRMGPSGSLHSQQNDIAGEMERYLDGR